MSAHGEYRARLRNAARANEVAVGYLRAAVLVDDFASLRRLTGAALKALVPESEIEKVEERMVERPAPQTKPALVARAEEALPTPAGLHQAPPPIVGKLAPLPADSRSIQDEDDRFSAAIEAAIGAADFPSAPTTQPGNPLQGLFD